MCVTPHLPEAASGRALSLICIPLWIAVKALVLRHHQFPLHQIGLPQSQVKALQ